MTGKADFSDEEWELVCEGPPTAGLLALTASSGGGFRESWAIGEVYAEARKDRGDSELLDDVVAERPTVKRYASPEELESEGLRRLGEAVALLEQRATPGETAGYRHFVLDVAGRVAEAHREKGEIASVSTSERAAIEKIAAELFAR